MVAYVTSVRPRYNAQDLHVEPQHLRFVWVDTDNLGSPLRHMRALISIFGLSLLP